MWKKRMAVLWMAVLFAAVCPEYVFAEETGAELSNITDQAGILTDDERNEFEAMAEEISKDHSCNVSVVVLSDYLDYGDDMELVAEAIFTEYRMGYGSDQDGVMLTLSMEDRDYWLLAHGDFANAAFTDYGKELLVEEFLDDFAEDDWAGGIGDYLTECDEYLTLAENGTPVVEESEELSTGGRVLASYGIAFVVALIAALIVCTCFKSQMKSARIATNAADYVDEGKADIYIRADNFTHMTHHRRKIETSSSNNTTVDSHGFSGTGGKF